MKYAGFWPRLMAHNIDLLFLLPVYYTIGYFIQDITALTASCSALTLTYEIGFVASPWSATPGKKIMNLEVLREPDKKPGLLWSLVRTIFKVLSLLTLFIGFYLIIFHQTKKSLHDILSGTVVIFSTHS